MTSFVARATRCVAGGRTASLSRKACVGVTMSCNKTGMIYFDDTRILRSIPPMGERRTDQPTSNHPFRQQITITADHSHELHPTAHQLRPPQNDTRSAPFSQPPRPARSARVHQSSSARDQLRSSGEKNDRTSMRASLSSSTMVPKTSSPLGTIGPVLPVTMPGTLASPRVRHFPAVRSSGGCVREEGGIRT